MQTIRVNLKENSYQIYIGFGIFKQLGQLLKQVGVKGRLVIVTNPVIEKLYGAMLKQDLNNDGFEVNVLNIPEGEEQKSLQNASKLYGELSNCHAERSTPILALGGGVIGDLAGFVAATYLRGVPFVQVPTTLLAQVDSSVGGKVAVDYNKLKNEIGAFYQPKLVLTDIATLRTLPARDIISGLAEIIKHALIWDIGLFDYIEENLNKIKMVDFEVIEELIVKAVKIKAEIIEKDEKDLNLRNILNYGHTIGHAIETVSDFKLKHGEAVAVGMLAAGKISNKLGMLSTRELSRIESIIKKAGLPASAPEFGVDQLVDAMRHDKKVLAGKIRFVLLASIGKATVIDEVSLSLVEEVLSDYSG
jgi:3-dehydroquinate synthase